MSVVFVLVQKDGLTKDIPVNKPVQIIGRQTDCQIRIPSASVSRHHCEIALRDGVPSVRDLGSSNGTYVNGKKVPQADLSPGDVVTVGDLIFFVRIDGKPERFDPEDILDIGTVVHTEKSESHSKAPTKMMPLPGKAPSPAKPKAPAKPAGDLDDSSVSDFDFLDEDEDIKKQPKL